MMTSMRTIIDLAADQLEALDAWCRAEGISRAEGVRRAIVQQVRHVRRQQPDAAFGLWRGRKEDGLEYERRIRREWDTRRSRR
jgi:hypothetical protein